MSGTVQINQLPAVGAAAAADALPIQQAADGVTRQVTPAQILSAAGGATVTQLVNEAATRAAADQSNANAAAAAASAASEAHGAAIAAAEAADAAQATANAALPNTSAAISIAMLRWLNALPTSPNSGGPEIWWNNSGILTYS